MVFVGSTFGSGWTIVRLACGQEWAGSTNTAKDPLRCTLWGSTLNGQALPSSYWTAKYPSME